MARPTAAMPPVEAVRQLLDDAGRLAARVTPGAKVEGLEIVGGRLQARVRAKPEDGKANEAVRGLLAAAMDVAPSRVELIRGATSREKQFRIS